MKIGKFFRVWRIECIENIAHKFTLKLVYCQNNVVLNPCIPIIPSLRDTSFLFKTFGLECAGGKCTPAEKYPYNIVKLAYKYNTHTWF